MKKQYHIAILVVLLLFSIIYAHAAPPCQLGCCSAGSPVDKGSSGTGTGQAATTVSEEMDDDEFEDFDEGEFEESGDEFESSSNDEFEEFSESGNDEFTESSAGSGMSEQEKRRQEHLNNNLIWVFWIMMAVVLSGILVRYHPTRKLRSVFLLGFMILLGFYRGGCPCPISSVQNTVLYIMGVDVPWQTLIWFLALIPATYLLGKTWCGWICHLGAMQEFLFFSTKLQIFKSEQAQKWMKRIRLALLITLIVQLIVTQSNLFIKIDPFKVAFNLFSTNTTGWVLLVLMLISSLFIYRPFCQVACPIGLILGWVAKFPGASILTNKQECNSCRICSGDCKIQAISRKTDYSVLDNKDCILCGDCLEGCRKNAITFERNDKEHNDIAILKRPDKPRTIDDFFDDEFPGRGN